MSFHHFLQLVYVKKEHRLSGIAPEESMLLKTDGLLLRLFVSCCLKDQMFFFFCNSNAFFFVNPGEQDATCYKEDDEADNAQATAFHECANQSKEDRANCSSDLFTDAEKAVKFCRFTLGKHPAE